MAGVDLDAGAGGGRRPLDARLNMIPMIDLLVACIAFLLITAVWSQTGAIEARHQPPARASDGPIIEPEQPDQIVRIHVSVDAVAVGQTAADRERFPRRGDGPTRLEASLRERRAVTPNTHEVWIDADPSISFDDVARVMDLVNGVWNRPGSPARVAIRVL